MLKDIFKQGFILLCVIFLFFFFLELVKEGFVSNHFDLNIILVLVIVFGLILTFYSLKNNN